ncbi:MAG TPA: hypothetical protein VEJ89_03200 [Myxococcaceae bacterium]|jgi:hypothetical protein|nr:hypothetical protein [Myxococcaceae bacterium]
MRQSIPVRLVAPELLFGVFHTLVWLLLVLQLSASVIGPLAEVVGSSVGVEARL